MLERISQYLPVVITSKFDGSYKLPRGVAGFGDRISSMAITTKEFGGLLSALFSAALSIVFPNVFKEQATPRRKQYDLANPGELREAFSKKPVKVLANILNLMETDFESAETIILNMARDWKKHPDRYLKYDKTNKESRRDTVGILDGLFEALVLTSEQHVLNQKCEDPELFENDEAMAISMSAEDWGKYQGKTPKLRKLREAYSTFRESKEKTKELFDPLFVCFLNELDLNLDGQSKHLNTNTEFTFGHLIERMLYSRSIVSLRSEDSYKHAQELMLNILQNYDDPFLTQFPIAKPLVEKLRNLLENERKADQIKTLVRKLVNIASPAARKSPPRRT